MNLKASEYSDEKYSASNRTSFGNPARTIRSPDVENFLSIKVDEAEDKTLPINTLKPDLQGEPGGNEEIDDLWQNLTFDNG